LGISNILAQKNKYEHSSTWVSGHDVYSDITGDFGNECRSMRNYLEAKEKQSFENQIPKDAKSQKSMERKREKKSPSVMSGSSRGMGEVLV